MFNLFAGGVRAALATLICLTLISTATEAATKATPALWKVENKDATVYLFGSYHLLPADLEWMTPQILEAFESSDILVTEADGSDETVMVELVTKLAMNPVGVTLASLLTKDEAARVDVAFGPLGLTVETSAPFQPWFVAIQAGVIATMRMGYDPELGVEKVLQVKAREAGMEEAYLETAEAGLASFAMHPADVQIKMLMTSTDDMDIIEDMMNTILGAWASGDIDTVGESLNASLSKTPEVMETAIHQRNRNWIPAIEDMLRTEKTYFIAVGAGHMAGDQSVIALLEAQGYEVRRLKSEH